MALNHAQIKAFFLEGKTQSEIGAIYGCTRQRIQQILAQHGISRVHGGAWIRETFKERQDKQIDQRCRARLGISILERRLIVSEHGIKPFRAFYTQRTNAGKRGIAFKLTFAEWWKLWIDSGHWANRGFIHNRHCYVMSRFGDLGAYELGNVQIISQSENATEYWARARQAETVSA